MRASSQFFVLIKVQTRSQRRTELLFSAAQTCPCTLDVFGLITDLAVKSQIHVFM